MKRRIKLLFLILAHNVIGASSGTPESDAPCKAEQRVLFVCINPESELKDMWGHSVDPVASFAQAALNEVVAPVLTSLSVAQEIRKRTPNIFDAWNIFTITGAPGFVLFVPKQLPTFIHAKTTTDTDLAKTLGLAPKGLVRTDIKSLLANKLEQTGTGEEFSQNVTNIFIDRGDYKAAKNYCAAPEWSIFLVAHGQLGLILDMPIKAFQKVLSFFDEHLKIKVFAYTTCIGGNINLANAYGDALKSFEERKVFTFPIAFDALSDAPVSAAPQPLFGPFVHSITQAASRAEIRPAVQYLFPLDFEASKSPGQVARIRWSGDNQFQPLFSSSGTVEITDMLAATHAPSKNLIIDTFFKERPTKPTNTSIIDPKTEKPTATEVERILITTNYVPFILQLKSGSLPSIIFSSAQVTRTDGQAYYHYGSQNFKDLGRLIQSALQSSSPLNSKILIDSIYADTGSPSKNPWRDVLIELSAGSKSATISWFSDLARSKRQTSTINDIDTAWIDDATTLSKTLHLLDTMGKSVPEAQAEVHKKIIERIRETCPYQYRLKGIMGAKAHDLLSRLLQTGYVSQPEILVDTVKGTDMTLYDVLIYFNNDAETAQVSFRLEPDPSSIRNSALFDADYSSPGKTLNAMADAIDNAEEQTDRDPKKFEEETVKDKKRIVAMQAQSEESLRALKKRYGVATIEKTLPGSGRNTMLLRELYKNLAALR